MKQEDRIYSLLGLASKAGLVASGEFSVEQSVKKDKARLVIVTDDASDNTKQLFVSDAHIPDLAFELMMIDVVEKARYINIHNKV